MTDVAYVVTAIFAAGLVTLGLRALPFIAGDWLNKHPFVQRLGRFLPLAIMTLLLVHYVVGAAQSHEHGPWPELVAVAAAIVLQWFARNPLLSIVGGTLAYVAMRNAGWF